MRSYDITYITTRGQRRCRPIQAETPEAAERTFWESAPPEADRLTAISYTVAVEVPVTMPTRPSA